MKEQINRLVELANEYAEFVGRTPIKTHIQMSYGNEYHESVMLYFTSNKEYSISFEKVEISEYSNSITIPLNYTSDDLIRVYNDAKKFLDEKKEEIKEQIKKEKEKERKIEELRKKLEELEKEITIK